MITTTWTVEQPAGITQGLWFSSTLPWQLGQPWLTVIATVWTVITQ